METITDCESKLSKRKKNKKKRKSAAGKNKKKKRQAVPPEIESDRSMAKYWVQRYKLFSKFDDGIKLDKGNWSGRSYCEHFKFESAYLFPFISW